MPWQANVKTENNISAFSSSRKEKERERVGKRAVNKSRERAAIGERAAVVERAAIVKRNSVFYFLLELILPDLMQNMHLFL